MSDSSPDNPISWTDDQRRAYQTEGSLLVSAAAGSGKTAVLAERCAFMVCDSPRPSAVHEILVLTFGKAAAAEMRGRIKKSLGRRLKGADQKLTARLRKQISLLEHAPISTIHSFCTRLLRQNFSLAGLDPQFRTLDDDEPPLLRREVAQDLFDHHFNTDTDARFRSLLDDFSDGKDDPLIEDIIRTHEMLCSLARPDRWLDDALARIAQAADCPLKDSDLGRQSLAEVEDALNSLNRRCAAILANPASLRTFPAYILEIKKWSALIDSWTKTLRRSGLDALRSAHRAFPPSKLPPIPKDAPGKDVAKSVMDAIKAELTDKGELANLLQFSESEWRVNQRATLASAETFLNLVREFGQHYEQAKRQLNAVDFADLERKALQVLATLDGDKFEPTRVARAYHAQFNHVLVDEFQDVNEIQDVILNLVARNCVAAEGAYSSNLFLVGDVKQSIYRFRLAEPRRFLEKLHAWRSPGAGRSVIYLRENFRSRPPLLESLNGVFERLITDEAVEIDYSDDHRLRPPKDAAKAPPEPIELHILDKGATSSADSDDDDDAAALDLSGEEKEATLCARLILSMTGGDGSAPQTLPSGRPVEFDDIAILLRSPKLKANAFADTLRRHGIPASNAAGTGFFEATEVRDMISLLSVLDNQQQDIPLAAILRSPLAQFSNPEDALAQIRLAYPDAKAVPFHQAVIHYPQDRQDELAAQLSSFLARLSNWREQSRKRPLADLIWHVYDQTGYLTFVAGLDDGPQRVANLLELHSRARQFGSFLKHGTHRFLRFLRDLSEQTDLKRPSLSSENQKAVRIMSIHGAKGLEFPVVILADLGKKHNLSDLKGSIITDRKWGLGIKVADQLRRIRYPSLAWRTVKNSLKRQMLAEELRLLYVAMTRAEQKLILVGSAKGDLLQTWRDLWQNHAGPLPADEILSANTPLDWLGPVWSATGADQSSILKAKTYAHEVVDSWPNPRAPRKSMDRLQHLAALLPLDPPPPQTPESQAVIARLQAKYRYENYTKLEAAKAVTSLEESDQIARRRFEQEATEITENNSNSSPLPPFPPVENSSFVSAVTLPLPEFLTAPAAAPPTEIGSATHLVLELLDFARAADMPNVESQIAAMVECRLLTPKQAAMVRRPSIAWFLQTGLGRLLQKNAAHLRREIPFALAQASNSSDPLDRVMLRGRIDLMFPINEDFAIVDYKTDNVTKDQIATRAETYRAQIETYRTALERLANKRVTAVYLVFLEPQIVREI
jgi:ATP-dependent helicase/nuclease subunit A